MWATLVTGVALHKVLGKFSWDLQVPASQLTFRSAVSEEKLIMLKVNDDGRATDNAFGSGALKTSGAHAENN